MKVFLAGTTGHDNLILKNRPKYVLESFYYIKEWQIELIKKCDMFLLDSGAFTFMNGKKGKIDWQGYIDSYINFINKYDVKYFFELDIDVVVGYENVKKITKYIEEKTSKKCIPVWHKGRGLEEWKRLTKEYDYVAIGGFVVKEIKPSEYRFIPNLLKIAKENNCKVHGLGFTNVKGMKKYRFYSVDSTNWTCGTRFANIYIYKSGDIKDILGSKRIKDLGYRFKKEAGAEITAHNLKEWLKFQEYADKNL